jgi:hypothetical protein
VLAYQYNIEHDMITKPQSFGMWIFMDYHVD